jgi:23S rRNA A1618 N6-methylase RlmF
MEQPANTKSRVKLAPPAPDDASTATLAARKKALEAELKAKLNEIDKQVAEDARARKLQERQNFQRQIAALDTKIARKTQAQLRAEKKRKNAQAFILGRHLLSKGIDDPAVQALLAQLAATLTKPSERALFGFAPLAPKKATPKAAAA